jgi:hypothetical protein
MAVPGMAQLKLSSSRVPALPVNDARIGSASAIRGAGVRLESNDVFTAVRKWFPVKWSRAGASLLRIRRRWLRRACRDG